MLDINVAIAQLELLPGDLDGNRDRIVDAIESAAGRDADVVVLPRTRGLRIPLHRLGRGPARGPVHPRPGDP